MRQLLFAAGMLLAPALALAANATVQIGITPASMHSHIIEVDAPAVTKQFTSAVPLKATMSAKTKPDGTIAVEVKVEALDTKLNNEIKGPERKQVSELIGNGGVLANTTIVVEKGSTGLYTVGAQSKGGDTVGLKVKAIAPKK